MMHDGTEDGARKISALSIVGVTVPGLVSCVVVAARAAEFADRSSFAGILLVALVAAVALMALACWPGPVRRAFRFRHARADALVGVTLAVVGVGVWARALNRNLRFPTVFTVDAAHHGALVAWIVDHQRLASVTATVDPLLGGLTAYPQGGHVSSAILSWASGVPPLTALWLVAVGSVATIFVVVAALACETSVHRSGVAGIVAVCLCLLAWRFTLGMVTVEFFFAQAVGLAITMAGVLAVVVGVRYRLAWWRWAPASAVFAAASYFTYPQQAAMVPCALGIGVWSTWRRDRERIGPKAIAAAVAGMALAVAAGLLLLRRSGFLNSGALFGQGEGVVATLQVARVGGWVPVVLVVWGVVVNVRSVFLRGPRVPTEGVPAAAVVLGAFAVPVGLALGLWSLQHGFPVHAPVTSYRISKNIFAAVPFAAVIAGSGVAALVPMGGVRTRAFAVAAAIVTMVVPFQPRILALTRTPIVSADGYALARWAGLRFDPTDIGLAGPGLEPYVLWWAGIRRPIPVDPNDHAEVPTFTRWADWPARGPATRYLLVSGRELADRYAQRPGVRLVRRLGTAALFERT